MSPRRRPNWPPSPGWGAAVSSSARRRCKRSAASICRVSWRRFITATPASKSLREATTPILIDELEAGRLDLALGALMADVVPPGIVAQPLFAEELVAIVAPDHPLARRGNVRIAELAQERFALAAPGSPIARLSPPP